MFWLRKKKKKLWYKNINDMFKLHSPVLADSLITTHKIIGPDMFSGFTLVKTPKNLTSNRTQFKSVGKFLKLLCTFIILYLVTAPAPGNSGTLTFCLATPCYKFNPPHCGYSKLVKPWQFSTADCQVLCCTAWFDH